MIKYNDWSALINDCRGLSEEMTIAENPLGVLDGATSVKVSSLIWAAAQNDIQKVIADIDMTAYRFSETYGIPMRTAYQWASGERKAPAYVTSLLAYVITNELLENET